MTRKELHALMTGMVAAGNATDYRLPAPVTCATAALELLEAAEEVYAKSEGFRGSIEALEIAARGVIEAHEAKGWQPRALIDAIQELRGALKALEPMAEKK